VDSFEGTEALERDLDVLENWVVSIWVKLNKNEVPDFLPGMGQSWLYIEIGE